ncbi:sulfite exporter TauE/SafE family protein [Cribrihabitans sp. XS_ASV171]
MSLQDAILLALGGFAGGFVNGFAGFGTALFAMGFFLIVLDPVTAVATIAPISVIVGLQGLWVVRREIRADLPRLLRFLLPGLAGVPVGLMLLSHIDAQTLRYLVAGMLILYGGYFGFRRTLPRFDRLTPVADGAVGLVGGILGGLAAISGALLALWVSMRPWPKAEARAMMQPYNGAILAVTVTLLAARGTYDAPTLAGIGVALPAALLAAQGGIFAFRRVADDQFRRVIILLCLAMGVGILTRDLWTG